MDFDVILRRMRVLAERRRAGDRSAHMYAAWNRDRETLDGAALTAKQDASYRTTLAMWTGIDLRRAAKRPKRKARTPKFNAGEIRALRDQLNKLLRTIGG